MSLKQTLEEDLKTALKTGDAFRTSLLRMISSAIHNREIQLLKKIEGLSDKEIIEVLLQEAKKRKDASTEFEKGGRQDLAAKEEREFALLKAYLPAEISDEDLERIIRDGMREVGASGIPDYGKVMKVIMPVLKGKASGERISEMLRRFLSS